MMGVAYVEQYWLLAGAAQIEISLRGVYLLEAFL